MLQMNQGHTAAQLDSRWLRAVKLLAKYGLSSVPFIEVGLFLARQPQHRAMLLFFLPAVVAAIFILADNGRFEKTTVRGAWILLTVSAIASFLAEVNFPPIKPLFAGILPPRIDRIFVFYVISWYTFVLVICPVWFLRWRLMGAGRSRGPIRWKFKLRVAVWLVGVVSFAILAGRKLF